MANYRCYDPVLLKKCGWLLKELEQQLKSKATVVSWTETRSKWIADVDAAVSSKVLLELYNLALNLEMKIKHNQKNEEWKNWKRDFWIAMYMGDSSSGVDTPPTITQFAKCVIDMEDALLFSSQKPSWKGERRCIWCAEAKSLMVPIENLLFALDVLDQIHKCIDNTTVSQWGQNVDSACSKLTECADVLEKVAKGAGITKATGGGVTIGGGVLALGGLIAAPFTAGLSLLATAAGTALALGGGLTSYTSSIVKNEWDKSKTNEGERLTKTVCKHANILSQCLTYYYNTMKALQEYLDTPEGKEFIAELKAIESNHSTLTGIINISKTTLKSGSKAVSVVLGGMKIVKALKILRIVSIIRPRVPDCTMSTNIAAGGFSRVSVRGITLFAGVAAGSMAARALSGIGVVVRIGFGIWDVVRASKDLKNGSEIAAKFRKLARDLNLVKRTVCDQYNSLVETN